MSQSRYIIGIDLGTTNSAIAYIDTLDARHHSVVMPIRQLDARGVVTESPTLPSFLFVPTVAELADPGLRIHGEDSDDSEFPAGRIAQNEAAALPGRVIHSAKSWLSHKGVDREDRLLPWASDEIAAEKRLSPVEVSARFLTHIRQAWDAGPGAYHEDYRFCRQEITITVPASFDESAQALTLEAAKLAGYPEAVRLLEEPQAAFYCWLEENRASHTLERLLPGLEDRPQLVLICDIGGGTTDFSLFNIRKDQSSEAPDIERIAVSDHLLLGGDNIDHAIARRFEQALAGPEEPISNRQWAHLVHQSRKLKERILEGGGISDMSQEFHVSIPGRGSSLLASSMSASMRASDLFDMLMEGFFPACGAADRPNRSQAGIREWGLPFAQDSAVTRHLAAFLHGRTIDAVLFTGGSLKPDFLQDRLQQIVASWQGGAVPVRLENPDMDLAVARGAAVYGLSLRDAAGRIRAGYARTLYLEVQKEGDAADCELVCILPRGFEPGSSLILSRPRLRALVDQPVRFQAFYSSTLDNQPGDLVRLGDGDFQALPPLQTVLRTAEPAGKTRPDEIDIQLQIEYSELGLLKLFCISNQSDIPGRWELQFNLRRETEELLSGAGADTGVAPERLKKAAESIDRYYGKKARVEEKAGPGALMKELESILGQERSAWNIPLLRALWVPLRQGITRRARSLSHEAVWLTLAGFLLRPGYGAELDAWRIAELWRVFSLGLSFPRESRSTVQWWIMWRRVAGGLDRERQEQLFKAGFPLLKQKDSEHSEALRALASLERLPLEQKMELSKLFIERASRSKMVGDEHAIWGLTRLGSRVPLYAGVNMVLPPDVIGRWFEQVGHLDWKRSGYERFNAMFAQTARVTGDRNRDLAYEVRLKIAAKMKESRATSDQLRVVREYVEMQIQDQSRLFGEALPSGVRLAAG